MIMPLWFWEMSWDTSRRDLPFGNMEHVEAKPTTRKEERRIFRWATK